MGIILGPEALNVGYIVRTHFEIVSLCLKRRVIIMFYCQRRYNRHRSKIYFLYNLTCMLKQYISSYRHHISLCGSSHLHRIHLEEQINFDISCKFRRARLLQVHFADYPAWRTIIKVEFYELFSSLHFNFPNDIREKRTLVFYFHKSNYLNNISIWNIFGKIQLHLWSSGPDMSPRGPEEVVEPSAFLVESFRVSQFGNALRRWRWRIEPNFRTFPRSTSGESRVTDRVSHRRVPFRRSRSYPVVSPVPRCATLTSFPSCVLFPKRHGSLIVLI